MPRATCPYARTAAVAVAVAEIALRALQTGRRVSAEEMRELERQLARAQVVEVARQ